MMKRWGNLRLHACLPVGRDFKNDYADSKCVENKEKICVILSGNLCHQERGRSFFKALQL